VFLILKVNGSRVREARMCERCCASLYAGAFGQLMKGRMGVLRLWTLTRPRILGVQVNDLPFGVLWDCVFA
jgi:hypothetical protein